MKKISIMVVYSCEITGINDAVRSSKGGHKLTCSCSRHSSFIPFTKSNTISIVSPRSSHPAPISTFRILNFESIVVKLCTIIWITEEIREPPFSHFEEMEQRCFLSFPRSLLHHINTNTTTNFDADHKPLIQYHGPKIALILLLKHLIPSQVVVSSFNEWAFTIYVPSFVQR